MSSQRAESPSGPGGVEGKREAFDSKIQNKGLGCRQFRAMLHKNWLLKKRSRCQLACEIFSPVFFSMILVLGWTFAQARVVHTPPLKFANTPIPLMGDLLSQVSDALSQSLSFSVSGLITQPSGMDPPDGYTCFDMGALSPGQDVCADLANLQVNTTTPVGGGRAGGGGTAGLAGDFTVNNLASSFTTFSNYAGPFPVMSLDGFVNLHNLIQVALTNSSFGDTAQKIESLSGGQLGNLPFLGVLAFAPNTAPVRDLVEYLRVNNTRFNQVFSRIYNSEQEAVDEALKTTGFLDRTWAVISFDQLDLVHAKVDYKIRTNYSFLPNTNSLGPRFFRGINTQYVKYYLSGFLTLQSTIDAYILEKIGWVPPEYTPNNALFDTLARGLTSGIGIQVDNSSAALTNATVALRDVLDELRVNTSFLNNDPINTTDFVDAVAQVLLLREGNLTGALLGVGGPAANITDFLQENNITELNPLLRGVTGVLLQQVVPRNYTLRELREVNMSALPRSGSFNELSEALGLNPVVLPQNAAVEDIFHFFGFNSTVDTLFGQLTRVLNNPAAIANGLGGVAAGAPGVPGGLAGGVNNFNLEELGLAGVNLTLQELQESISPNEAGFVGIPMPVPAFSANPFYTGVGPLVGLLFCMSIVYPTSRLIKAIVEEKETRMKELLKMMGLKDWVFASSWFVTYMILFFVISVIQTLVLQRSVLARSNGLFCFVYFYLFNTSCISFAFMVSTFFSKAKLAANLGPILLFVTIMPKFLFFTTADNEVVSQKIASGLLSASAFAFGADILMEYEGSNVGFQWADLYADDLSMGAVLGMMFFDTLLYLALAWYLEKVLPNEYGTRRHPLFCFERLWMKKSEGLNVPMIREEVKAEEELGDHVEKPPSSVSNDAAISIRHLMKTFAGHGRKDAAVITAVDDLSLTMYNNQITSLLGHNGAGKTTTISMLTGLISPSSGQCLINGMDISTDMRTIRKSLGVCPQHNVLFDTLSCEEHLRLCAALKGVRAADIENELQTILDEVGLGKKKRAYSSTLSGGMKRKLSVAMALIGGSKVVFLDEPTSGMDPYSRRATWDLIRKYKQDRAIVLTTHFMDEADLLGDRIAIMTHGQLKCCGSSLFLKNRYGVGYNLTMVKARADCDANVVSSLVMRHVPTSKLASPAGGEISFTLPFTAVPSFPNLFREIEASREQMGVGGYGVSMTTLEDVFVRITSHEMSDSLAPTKVQDEAHDKVGFMQKARAKLETRPKAKSGAEFSLCPKCHKAMNVDKEHICSGGLSASSLGVDTVTESQSGIEMKEMSPSATTKLVETNGDETPRGSASLREDRHESTTSSHAQTEGLDSPHAHLVPEKKGASYWVQFRELVRKRFLISLRDRKGRFVETVVPVVVVILVLLILTNTYNLAGPSLQLNYGLYATSRDVRSGTPTESYWKEVNSPDARAMKSVAVIKPTNTNTSDEFEDYLLRNYFHNAGLRYGTFVNDDVLTSSYLVDPITIGVYGSEGGARPSPAPYLFNLSLTSAMTVMHNSSRYHCLPVLAAELTSARMRSVHPNATYGIRNHPLPLTKQGELQWQTFLALFVALFILIPFSFLPAQFSVFLVKERTVKAKHLQLVSGVHPVIYWLSNYVWDLINYLFVLACVMVVFACYNSAAFTGTVAKSSGVFMLLWLYGFAVIPLSYCYSFLFDNHSSAQVGIIVIHFICGFVLTVISFVLDADVDTYVTNQSLKPWYRLLPPFTMGEGLISLTTLDLKNIVASNPMRPFDWEVLGRSLVYLAGTTVAYFLLTLAFEYRIFARLYNKTGVHEAVVSPVWRKVKLSCACLCGKRCKPKPVEEDGAAPLPDKGAPQPMDEDVIREREYIKNGNPDDAVVWINGLTKQYPPRGNNVDPVLAVDNLHLSIPLGQCFGFLGINGAGKTTTMQMLTGDTEPTSGKAHVRGFSILEEMGKVRLEVGYCPQFDPLLDLMTAREHLVMYARLRGLTDEAQIKFIVNKLLNRLGLKQYADNQSGGYSGGNKRKLSLGLALIGNPAVVFLDEPSTGMDPLSRRFMWGVISEVAKERSVILTSHSMEESEALCGRIGIMVNGTLRCIGTTQHLKSKFGEGYHLEVSMDEAHAKGVISFVETQFPGSVCEENQLNRLKFRLPASKDLALSLASIFELVETNKTSLQISEYSISQPTLEQIFLLMAKQQHTDSVP